MIWAMFVAEYFPQFQGNWNRAVASLTVPGGQELHFPHFFLKFRSLFLILPQTFLIFFLILGLWVGESSTREGPGYATELQVTFPANGKGLLTWS